MTIESLVFDFDGIIVDTEPVHYAAYQVILEPRGLGFNWDDYQEFYMGSDDRDAFRRLFERLEVPLASAQLAELIAEKARVFQELAVNAMPFPGVVELAQSAGRQVKVGLCSGALRSDIVPVVDRLGIAGIFRAIVTADEVAASKPDPTCYRLVLQRLGVADPAACIAIEDTPAGIAAAKGAGLRVVAVTNSHTDSKLLAADACIDTLEGLTLEDLASLTGLA